MEVALGGFWSMPSVGSVEEGAEEVSSQSESESSCRLTATSEESEEVEATRAAKARR